mgnify:CR=1 FL=1
MVRVLVVEDEANIREMIALNLRLTGMEAVEAESAEAALPLLAKKPGCDAAILDVMLPGMNGFFALSKRSAAPTRRSASSSSAPRGRSRTRSGACPSVPTIT